MNISINNLQAPLIEETFVLDSKQIDRDVIRHIGRWTINQIVHFVLEENKEKIEEKLDVAAQMALKHTTNLSSKKISYIASNLSKEATPTLIKGIAAIALFTLFLGLEIVLGQASPSSEELDAPTHENLASPH